MRTIGYFPYVNTAHSAEAQLLREHLSVAVRVAHGAPSLNVGPPQHLPALDHLVNLLEDFMTLPAVVAEGPGGFLWAALLRAHGFAGTVTILPYLNPRRWYDVAAAALYRCFADPGDRVFLGSGPSAAVYRALGVKASVGEPYGIDDKLFRIRPGAAKVWDELRIPAGRLLLFAGRAQPDKDLYRLLRVSLRARLLFHDLQVVVASHVTDPEYLAVARKQLRGIDGVHFILDPGSEQLADLYNVADVFVTASTSQFETFGRAPAEALACGSPAVAPRYDGFIEVLGQLGGTLVDVEVDPATGTPYVPEELLLRAAYDTLSSPRLPPRQQIAAIAQRRFGQSTTIGLLGYLANEDVRRPAAAVPSAIAGAANIELPCEWHRPLAEIEKLDARDALSWFWDGCDHDHLSAHDDQFAAQVRRSLCARKVGHGEELVPCP
jgi:glycosyltransferase involved in cell wall biosynthesis